MPYPHLFCFAITATFLPRKKKNSRDYFHTHEERELYYSVTVIEAFHLKVGNVWMLSSRTRANVVIHGVVIIWPCLGKRASWFTLVYGAIYIREWNAYQTKGQSYFSKNFQNSMHTYFPTQNVNYVIGFFRDWG